MSIMAEGKRKGVKGIAVGIDLARKVLAVHAVDDNGKLLPVKPKVARRDLAQVIAHVLSSWSCPFGGRGDR